ncbi:RagB/SusD family nutrient uptake outer membrane protein [Sphingobacterium lactis]|uniref:RagB/SusD family nutrient uptake outer membrane protein n=1 Tax=Sphingobacterium lactis TaxID=797291 RepID=UPI003F7D7B2C
MKSYKFILASIFLINIGCNDSSLDISPTDQLTDVTVWQNAENAGLFLNDIYNQLNPGPVSSVWTNLPSEISNDPLDNFSDNSVSGNLAGIPSYEVFTQGAQSPSIPIYNNFWKDSYAKIRKCNLLIEKVSNSNFPDNKKKSLVAQGRFLRAYYYRSLMQLYGGVPLITKVLDRVKDGEAIFQPRNTLVECVTFIEKECEDIAIDLPLKAGAKDIGRATKGAAWALKAEVQLQVGKYAESAETCLKIMNSGAGYDLFSDYGTLFFEENEGNKEVIFDIQYAAEIKGTITEKYWNPTQTTDGTGWQAVNPTQDLIDEYEFLDGKTESEGSTQFNPNDPYKNRDKRFYASIIYDGASWKTGVINSRLGIPNNKNQFGNSGATRTGYYLRKKVNPAVVPGVSSGQNSIVWRYAEILLNYAESKNEVLGQPDKSIYDAINKIRTRAGLPDLPLGLNKDQMRSKIRHERRIELAFEGKRLFDLWRWKTAEQVFSKPLRAMKITVNNGTLVFDKIAIDGGKIKFDASKNYLMPIPETVRGLNPKIDQNPNY